MQDIKCVGDSVCFPASEELKSVSQTNGVKRVYLLNVQHKRTQVSLFLTLSKHSPTAKRTTKAMLVNLRDRFPFPRQRRSFFPCMLRFVVQAANLFGASGLQYLSLKHQECGSFLNHARMRLGESVIKRIGLFSRSRMLEREYESR